LDIAVPADRAAARVRVERPAACLMRELKKYGLAVYATWIEMDVREAVWDGRDRMGARQVLM
jgi:hypothetical protein